ncbi:DUF2752 domain-containing protein [Luteolibacter yonseiensis]|uniref:DUF2752 domain-containing protein n=1 Tax=Luteolibacter yonseiensis TaxID=1144680 RepID=A0A934R9W4_9BACT|nr:DUF2752 domain-containing protein [Luteolibacter yonseiensis]MBK1818175.1 DUF2752 domain-containing protein [Luteolibacter yonseiensis]
MRADRALWIALGVLLLSVAAYLLRQSGPNGLPWLPRCMFHEITGLHCAGCGMTRAAYAALHGEIGTAFRYNPVGMILLPLAGMGVGLQLLGWVRGRPLPFRLDVGVKGGWGIAIALIAFWILRNIPSWPFTLLAPP